MYQYGAKWAAADISENQIEQAKIRSKGMDIDYHVVSTEDINFSDNSFDVITACQCFWYFEHETVMPKFYRMLKQGGSILVLYMAWLPFEDEIAGAGEKLVLKYNPNWSGAGETENQIDIPDCYKENFELVYHEEFTLRIPFTHKGIERMLNEAQVAQRQYFKKYLLYIYFHKVNTFLEDATFSKFLNAFDMKYNKKNGCFSVFCGFQGHAFSCKHEKA